MSITEDLGAVVAAANNLTKTVTDKIGSIDQRVNTFETDARNLVNTITNSIYQTQRGYSQSPSTSIQPNPEDDTGLLVQQAFDNGNKYVIVDWPADGQERHWNTMVTMPMGANIFINGPASGVEVLGGSIRSDRGCYNYGRRQGTSTLGSPMIFRNLEPSDTTYPYSDYAKVWDYVHLIKAMGNNIILFGDGTYLHDQGGMAATAEGSALISVEPYLYGTPVFIGSGGHQCQFYLSGPLVNNRGGTSTCDIRFGSVYFSKTTSDGPLLTADKGYKRLKDKGVAGVTDADLNKQPYERLTADAALNDNVHQNVHLAWINQNRGIDAEIDRPKLVGATSWAFGSGWTTCQILDGLGQVSLHGLDQIAGTHPYTTFMNSR